MLEFLILLHEKKKEKTLKSYQQSVICMTKNQEHVTWLYDSNINQFLDWIIPNSFLSNLNMLSC